MGKVKGIPVNLKVDQVTLWRMIGKILNLFNMEIQPVFNPTVSRYYIGDKRNQFEMI